MKTLKLFFVLIVLALFSFNINAQDIEVIYYETTIYEPPGINVEIVFDIEIVNISALEQNVFFVRTLNNLPQGWTSSLCFDVCAAPQIDSIFTISPLQPDDTLRASVHVYPDSASIATAYIQVQLGALRSPNDRTTIDYTATTDPSVDVEEEVHLNSYELKQNYPNPFNPSTKISYGIQEAGFVNLKVYNILGSEVATLVNEHKAAGNYEVSFGKNELASGVYIYRLTVNNFIQTRKMILEK